MKTLPLGTSDLTASNIVLGCMRIRDKSDAEIRQLVSTALEAGITMFDHADIYGGDHACEKRFSQALGSDYLDVLLLHRPDALVEPEEVAQAFDELHAAGKVRHFGVSNHTRGQLELLRATVRQPLLVNQLQLSLTHAPMIAEGVALNMQHDQALSRTDGILDYCRLTSTTIQAWSPFQSGDGTGPFVGNSSYYLPLNETLNRLAAEYGVSPDTIATAWITRHPAAMQVVVGTTSPQRVRDAVAGSELPLTREQWYEVFRAAGYVVP